MWVLILVLERFHESITYVASSRADKVLIWANSGASKAWIRADSRASESLNLGPESLDWRA